MRFEPIVLTIEDIKRNAVEAFLAGRLSYQAEDPSERKCAYRTREGRPCIIGASIPDDKAKLLRELNGKRVVALFNLHLIEG